MKLIFLGTGSAFTAGDGNYQSNMVFESDGHKKLLIDCGSDARHSLLEQGFSVEEIKDVYISHLHADHIGGLEWLAFSSKYNPQGSYKACIHISHEMVADLWNKALSAGLNPFNDPSMELSSFFQVDAVSNRAFTWEGITFHLFPTLHVVSETYRMPCYGLWFEIDQKMVLISEDTQLNLDETGALYDASDLIFHDCETQAVKSGVHAHYDELKELNPAIKRKMWLYHYQSGPLPDAKRDGFKGFVKKGQVFDFNKKETFD